MQIVLSTGRQLTMQAVLAFFATELPIQLCGDASTRCPERNALRYKLRSFRRLLGESRESNSATLLSSMLKAFTRGMSWARNHRLSKNEQQRADAEIEDGQTRQRNRYALRPFGVKPLGMPNTCVAPMDHPLVGCLLGRGMKKTRRRNATGPTVNTVETSSSGGQHKEMFPPFFSMSFKGSHACALSDKMPRLASGNISLRSAAINHPLAKRETSLRQWRPRFSASRRQPLLPSQKTPRAATRRVGRGSNSEEAVASEGLLEAIKPDEWNSPPSHLEAESDKMLLHPAMLWSSSEASSIQSLWDENVPSFSERRIRTRPSFTSSSEGKESEGSDMSFVGSESSIENPFYDSLDLLDRWDEECVYREAKWLHLSPNLVYGVEDIEEREDVRHTAVRGEMDEIKTKWISVNDFI